MSSLPLRYVNALTVDPNDPAHVYAVFGGFSRHWVPNAGVGHVFESTDGGAHWTDISGNLPDAPANDLVIINEQLAGWGVAVRLETRGRRTGTTVAVAVGYSAWSWKIALAERRRAAAIGLSSAESGTDQASFN